MIDAAEQLVTLAELARELPGKPHPATVARWCSKGIRGIKLWSERAGGRRCSTREAVQRFFAATGGAKDSDVNQLPQTQTSAVETGKSPSTPRVHWSIDPELRHRGENERRLLLLEGPGAGRREQRGNLETAGAA
jgi:hypothetical protein